MYVLKFLYLFYGVPMSKKLFFPLLLAGGAYLYIYFSSIYIGETFPVAEVSFLTLFWPPAIKKVPILRLCAFCPLRRIVVPRPPPPWSGEFFLLM